MEVIKIADEIQKKIDALDTIRKEVRKRADAKAKAISDYDKQIAIVLIQLKLGKPMDLDGHTIEKTPTTLCEKIAKGICWRERLELEQAAAAYASAVSNLDVLRAQLNGLQSIFRHLEEIGGAG